MSTPRWGIILSSELLNKEPGITTRLYYSTSIGLMNIRLLLLLLLLSEKKYDGKAFCISYVILFEFSHETFFMRYCYDATAL